MKTERRTLTRMVSTAVLAAFSAVSAAEPTYKAEVPSSIVTPDEVETRIGTLRFTDGAPDAGTVELVYDHLDFIRGVEAFLDGIPAASIYGAAQGFREAGMGPQSIGIFEDLMDARSVFLTPNSTTVYVTKVFDLEAWTDGDRDAGLACWGRWMTPISGSLPTSGSPEPTRAKGERTCSFRRGTRANCPKRDTSSTTLRPTRR